MNNIYNYHSSTEFLRDTWNEKRKTNPSFSIRAWAKMMGMKAHGPLHQMVLGNRSIPKKYVIPLAKSLKLESKEIIYFETLIDLERAKSPELKQLYAERLQDLVPKKKISFLEVENFRYLKDPLHMLILEMTMLKDFKSDAKWIKERINLNCTVSEVEDALDRLVTLGLMSEDQQGNFSKTNKNLYSKQDVKDLGLQEYHKNLMKLAGTALEKQEVSEREFNAYSISIEKNKIPRAKELIRKFMNDFAIEIEAKPNEAEETYQLNIQFFGMTKGEHK